jgi:uncharacterized protein with GYD domain
MATYIILSRFAPDAFDDPRKMHALAKEVSTRIEKECPKLVWKHSYSTLGRYDVVDIVETDDPAQLQRAVMILRAYGHQSTETLAATPWKEFLQQV